MNTITTVKKYSQSEVVSCWQNLSRAGLQRAEREMTRRYLRPDSRVLDVGCGAGRAVLALGEAGFNVTGLDISLPMLAAGRVLSEPARFCAGNLLNLPFETGSFEAVVMLFGALQHIPGQKNRRLALAELARVTTGEGRLIVGLDNLAPGLLCYVYWAVSRISRRARSAAAPVTPADTALWSRESRRVQPLVWHWRGLARTLRWRTGPGLVDALRRLNPFPAHVEPGDAQVAQFSLQATPGKIFYHVYRANQFLADTAAAGWRPLAHFSGTELSEDRTYPPLIRRHDKQQFFALEKAQIGKSIK